MQFNSTLAGVNNSLNQAGNTFHPPPTPVITIVLYYCYIFIGLVGTLGNCLTIIAVGRSSSMRDKFILQWGLATCDAINSCTNIVAGTIRLGYWREGLLTTYRSQASCLASVFVTPFTIGNQVAPVIELFICIDRYVAICWPVTYFALENKRLHGLWAIGITYAYTFVVIGIGYACELLIGPPKQVLYSCPTAASLGNFTVYDAGILPISTSIISIALIITTVVAIRRHMKHLQSQGTQAKLRYLQQVQITKMMFVIYLSMLLFIVANVLRICNSQPNIIGPEVLVFASPIAGIGQNVHAAINPLIYAVMCKGMRQEFVATLRWITAPLRKCFSVGKATVYPQVGAGGSEHLSAAAPTEVRSNPNTGFEFGRPYVSCKTTRLVRQA